MAGGQQILQPESKGEDMKSILLPVAGEIVVLLLFVTGCGGGGGRTIALLNISGSGYLGNSEDTVYSSGLYMDQVGFTATRNGRITVTMSSLGSDTVDPMIYVVKNDANYTYVASDDDSGEGLNAVCSFIAVAGQSYYAWFTTSSRYDSGTYSYTITEGELSLSVTMDASDQSSELVKHKSGNENRYDIFKNIFSKQ
jgi:hypothetical protein